MGYELMKHLPAVDLQEAASILEDQALWFGKITEIGERHRVAKGTVRSLLKKAAEAGDEEAKALIDAGILELTAY